MVITEEQEKELERMMLKSENETSFQCTECMKRLTGMKNVRKHLEEKKHYSYSRSDMKGVILVG